MILPVILMATGTEVHAGNSGCRSFGRRGRRPRLCRMPCTEVFNAQDARRIAKACCRRQITRRVAIEAGVTDLWWRYVGPAGKVMGVDRYGESAPGGRGVQATLA